MNQEERDNVLLLMAKKLETLEEQNQLILKKVSKLEDRMTKLEEKVTKLEEKVIKLEQRMTELEKRYNIFEKEIKGQIGERDNLLIDLTKEIAQLKINMDERFEMVNEQLRKINLQLTNHRKNMARLEELIMDRTAVLFDVSEIQDEKIRKFENELNLIKKHFKWYDLKFKELTSNSN